VHRTERGHPAGAVGENRGPPGRTAAASPSDQVGPSVVNTFRTSGVQRHRRRPRHAAQEGGVVDAVEAPASSAAQPVAACPAASAS